jgi:hypothetical protein
LNNGDPGANYTASGLATHSLMSYKHASGAIVFGAGTTRWSWGLDATHDAGDIPSGDPAPTTDLNIQQATVNLLADMGLQPQTLAGNLVPSSPSTDTVPPVTSITRPAAKASLTQNTAVQITGTAVDAAGQVCGVEVSVDGGTTWRPAQPMGGTQGFSTWAFTWTPTTTGSATIMARGVDDSLNQESPVSTSVTVVAGGAAQSLWPNNPTPSIVTVNDPNAVELGVNFQSSQAGGVLGIRFYKGPQNTGTHVGSLWDSGGNLLGQVTFSGETASGWQQMSFATPINISANTTYIASYHNNGFYSADQNYFATAYISGTLTALASSNSGGNGVYLYGAGGFPTNTYNASNYWVDVVFQAAQSLWPNNPTPSIVTVNDPNAVELGVNFQSSQAGGILGIRFYKGPQNTGTHVGSLWDSGGNLLGQVTFSGETASGWQQMNFATPINISANTTYIASYHTNGFYSADQNYFATAYISGTLTARASSNSGGNGVYLYGAGGFPTNTYDASNYW